MNYLEAIDVAQNKKYKISWNPGTLRLNVIEISIYTNQVIIPPKDLVKLASETVDSFINYVYGYYNSHTIKEAAKSLINGTTMGCTGQTGAIGITGTSGGYVYDNYTGKAAPITTTTNTIPNPSFQVYETYNMGFINVDGIYTNQNKLLLLIK